MAVIFLDSSAVVKRYVREAGSAWIHGLFGQSGGNDVWIARITAVEVTSALARRAVTARLPAGVANSAFTLFRQDLRHDYQIIGVDQPVVEAAMVLAERHALRGYDAVQLAAASQLQAAIWAQGLDPITLVSADTELNAAALAEGIRVEDPNTHI